MRRGAWLAIAVASLGIAGCGGGGGGGLSGFFESVASIFEGSSSSGGDIGSSVGDLAGSFSSGGDITGPIDGGSDIISAATVHHPEPASVALFGGGLAGMAWLRRRKKVRRQAK